MKEMSVWGWFFGSLRPFKWQLTLLVLAAIIIGIAAATTPMLFQSMIDTAIEQRAVEWSVVAVYFVVMMMTAIPLTFTLRERLLTEYTYQLRGLILRHLLRMDMSFYEDKGSTKIISEVGKGVGACSNLIQILSSGQLLISLPVALFAVFYISNFSLTAVLLLAVVCFITLIGARQFVGKKLEETEEKYQERDNDLTFRQREVVQFASVVRVYHAGATEEKRYSALGGEIKILSTIRTMLIAKFRLLIGMTGIAVDAIVIVIFLPQLITDTISLGTFFAIYLYAGKVIEPATSLGDVYSEIKQAKAQLKPLIEVLRMVPQVTEQGHALTLNPLRDSITLSRVSFQYPGTVKPVLHDVSLTIPAGKTTAIVGLTGSGKSSLAKVLMRLYDTTGGVVEYDGVDVRNLSFASLYSQIAYLSQEVPIFTDTVMANVTFGLESEDETAVHTALARASANFVLNREDGIFAKIGEMGKKLSGGEKQRIALARVLRRNPPIILLDEATSALDTKTEAEINDVFQKLSSHNSGKTMIVIAHRMSTVMHADQIVVLHEGRIIDIGKHDELLVRCMLYQELHGTFVN